MFLEITAPSKTFLLGEYLVTQTGQALVLNTQPAFKLQVHHHPSPHQGIENLSPAGKFIQERAAVLNNYQINFIDPHQHQGGLGASSAQFLMVYVAHELINHNYSFLSNPNKILNCYKQISWDGAGIAPSGADVLAQFTGGLSQIAIQANEFANLDWPFKDIEFYLIRTNNKIATHQHLQEIEGMDFAALSPSYDLALQALHKNNADLFIQAIRDYAATLSALNLVHPQTQTLLTTLNTPFILAAKGCGALGADIILVLVDKQQTHLFLEFAHKENLNIVATHDDLAPGLQITEQDMSA